VRRPTGTGVKGDSMGYGRPQHLVKKVDQMPFYGVLHLRNTDEDVKLNVGRQLGKCVRRQAGGR
jgi:hypothetical protein